MWLAYRLLDRARRLDVILTQDARHQKKKKNLIGPSPRGGPQAHGGPEQGKPGKSGRTNRTQQTV